MKQLIGLAVAMALAACGESSEAGVEGAWVRLPAAPGRPGAAYFHLRNGATAETLVGVSTPAAIRSELHESMSAGGAMSMAPVKSVALGAGESVTFAPGGKHVMLYDLSPTLKAGDKVPLTLTFADGETMQTEAMLVAPGQPAPSGAGEH